MLPGASASASTLASARKVFVKSAPSSYIAVSRCTWRRALIRGTHIYTSETSRRGGPRCVHTCILRLQGSKL